MGNNHHHQPKHDADNHSAHGETEASAGTGQNDADDSARQCIDCKKPPQMQCLHCSKLVCMECVQIHIAKATEFVDGVQDYLNKKIAVVEHLSVLAKDRVEGERRRLMEQVDVQCDQALLRIDGIAEEQKTKIREKNDRALKLLLNEIPSVTRQIIDEMQYLTEDDDQIFRIVSTLPTVVVLSKE